MIGSRLQARGSDEGPRGQALVEFALVAPIFFLLIFSVIQLGLLFGGQNGVVSAARETARYASTYRVAATADATAVCPLAIQELHDQLARSVPGFDDSREGTPAISYLWLRNPDGPGGSPGSYYVQIRVSVRYFFPLYVPLVENILDDGSDPFGGLAKTLTATEEMRIENTALAVGYPEVDCAP